jgi:YHS domain-containing protein
MGIFSPETDPVCGMEVDQGKTRTSGRTISYHGQTYFFCSDDCKKKFETDPTTYAAEATARAPMNEWAPPAIPPASNRPVESDEGIREAGIPTAPKVRGMQGSRPRVNLIAQKPAPPPARPDEVEIPDKDLAALNNLAQLPQRKTSIDPVSRITVDEESATAVNLKFQYKGRNYFFVSKESKEQFQKNPGQYAAQAEEVQATAVGEAIDPVCGVKVDTTAPGVLKEEYQGKTYFFSSPSCRDSFVKDPGKYVK